MRCTKPAAGRSRRLDDHLARLASRRGHAHHRRRAPCGAIQASADASSTHSRTALAAAPQVGGQPPAHADVAVVVDDAAEDVPAHGDIIGATIPHVPDDRQ